MKRIFTLIITFIMLFVMTACQDKASAFDEQYDLGIKYLTDGNYEEAIIAFEAAIEIDSKNPNAYIKLADVYIEMGDEDRAREVIEDGLTMLPDNKKLIRKRETIISVSLSGEVTTGIWDNIIKGGETVTEVTEAPVTEPAAKPTKDYITIKGEQYSTSLTELNLYNKELTDDDIKELSEMTNLTSLCLGSNYISDIAPLSELTNLTDLCLQYNNISDISTLAGLTNLTDLDLVDTNISDISPLAKLIDIEILALDGNSISDISPLAALTNLKYLYLGNNNISDISPLAKLTRLHILSLDVNNINDISPLAKLINLASLNLYDNNINDISPLAKLTNLNCLSLAVNDISNLSPLAKLTNLTELRLDDNNISISDKEALKKALPNCHIIFC